MYMNEVCQWERLLFRICDSMNSYLYLSLPLLLPAVNMTLQSDCAAVLAQQWAVELWITKEIHFS